MKSDSGWWARHTGQQQPQQQIPYAFQQQAAQQAPQQPQQFQPQVPQAPQPQQQPQVTIENFTKAMNLWQGGEATRYETQRCPSCGSNHYFSRSQSGGVINMNTGKQSAPSPMCFDCGYNSVHHQETVQGQGVAL